MAPISRIKATSPTLDSIQENSRSASISIGVLHQGEVIYTRSAGFRDATEGKLADVHTTYLCASLTKAFIAACCGILVDEGKLQWTAPLQTYLPFKNHIDPVIGQRATVQDALSHSTGLAHLDLSWLGVEGHSIAEREHLLDIVSHLPPVSDLRAGFHYNNYMFAVVGKTIEEQAGCPWSDFLRTRILEPLRMDRTTTNRTKLPDGNLADPFVVLDDRSLLKLKPVDVADDTVMGAAGGVWSCVSDMMKWAQALLAAMDGAPQGGDSSSPLKQIPTIVAHKNSITTSSVGENTYAMGFARAMIPSTELGMISLNGPQRHHIMGQASPPRLVLYHNGGQSGYLSAFYLFPETRSAIVALGNSNGLGDGPDWSAQAITQAMFDLQPRVDFAKASYERGQFEYDRYKRLVADFEKHKRQELQARQAEPGSSACLEDFLGRFRNEGLKMTLDITADDLHDDGSLHLIFNNRESQHHRLRPFAGDRLGFLPASREELLSREFIDWFRWDQFILHFRRNEESDLVVAVDWAMQVGLDSVRFERSPV